jgi:hypothetical protein
MHAPRLTWSASSDLNVTEYHVYRWPDARPAIPVRHMVVSKAPTLIAVRVHLIRISDVTYKLPLIPEAEEAFTLFVDGSSTDHQVNGIIVTLDEAVESWRLVEGSYTANVIQVSDKTGQQQVTYEGNAPTGPGVGVLSDVSGSHAGVVRPGWVRFRWRITNGLGQRYGYEIRAVDANGNQSEPSTPASLVFHATGHQFVRIDSSIDQIEWVFQVDAVGSPVDSEVTITPPTAGSLSNSEPSVENEIGSLSLVWTNPPATRTIMSPYYRLHLYDEDQPQGDSIGVNPVQLTFARTATIIRRGEGATVPPIDGEGITIATLSTSATTYTLDPVASNDDFTLALYWVDESNQASAPVVLRIITGDLAAQGLDAFSVSE